MNVGDGCSNHPSVDFLREAMVVDKRESKPSAQPFVQAGLAAWLGPFRRISLGGDSSLIPSLMMFFCFVVMAATARDHQCLERLLAVMISKGRKLEHKC